MLIQRFGDTTNYIVTQSLCQHLAELFLSRVPDSDFKAEVYGAILDDDVARLVELDFHGHVTTASEARVYGQVLALYQKRDDLPLDVDREKVAFDKFTESERSCRETNDLFRQVAIGAVSLRPEVSAVLYYARRKIASVLGAVPSFCDVTLRLGPGATTTTRKSESSSFHKLDGQLACSEAMYPIILPCLKQVPRLFERATASGTLDVRIDSGRLSFVPKNAKTDRAIVVEPVLNTMFQAGYGDYIARRLRKVGIDIRDQTRNQGLARLASTDTSISTIDLSSASDTISRGIVEELLPLDWVHTLSRFRTPTITYRGDKIRLEKFSSMGNGFTFPLETLIFYGLLYGATVQVTGSGDMTRSSVYGDDIVAETAVVPLLFEVLQVCGFKPNASKSFCSTDYPFRESCGADFFLGENVRPVFLRGTLSGQSAFTFHNGFIQRCEFEAAELVRQALSDELRSVIGPPGLGDGHLHRLPSDPDPFVPYRRHEGWAGYTFSTFVAVGKELPLDAVSLVSALYHPSNAGGTRAGGPGRRSNLFGLRDYALRHQPLTGRVNQRGDGRQFVVAPTPATAKYRRIKVYTLDGSVF